MKILRLTLAIAVLLLVGGAQRLLAINASPEPIDFHQPDGTKITLHLMGDEFFHWFEDLHGYTVMRVGNSYYYAQLNADKELEATNLLVGQGDPSTLLVAPHTIPPRPVLPPNTNLGQQPYRPWARPNQAKTGGGAQTNTTKAAGTVKNLVVLCLFSGDTVAANARQQSDYDTLFNHVGVDKTLAPTGSVRDAYNTLSYGTVTMQSTVLAWVTLPHNAAYYAGSNNGLQGTEPNAKTMVKDALALVDPLVNFADFDTDNDGYIDAIDFIHSGYGAEATGAAGDIWSHKSSLATDWVSADSNANNVKVKVNLYHTEPALWGTSGTDIVHIGVICHETGHFFGLPDLYDTDYSSVGIGSWCLMANSWGFDNKQLNPPHFSAWCRIFLGFCTPTVLTGSGSYTINQAETDKTIYKINNGFPLNEYLLVENREPTGLETIMPNGGLAIWHIDENVADNTNEGYPGQSGWPGNGKHYKVALLQADGRYDMEKSNGNTGARGDGGDVYPGTSSVTAIGMSTVPNTDAYKLGAGGPTANRITNISAAGATMTFTYSVPIPVLYVDSNFSGTSNGSDVQPFKTVHDAYNAATNGTTIIIRAASYSEGPLTNLNKQVTFDSRLGASTIN